MRPTQIGQCALCRRTIEHDEDPLEVLCNSCSDTVERARKMIAKQKAEALRNRQPPKPDTRRQVPLWVMILLSVGYMSLSLLSIYLSLRTSC